ncbi:MAG TPA: hypothetical protein VFC09_07550 [Candidatus Dormibacteraeota bacterium]|nr:hypothetical protein [Candidatus Dormibacteraeota bacterium]
MIMMPELKAPRAIAAGVQVTRLQPGGKDGPDNCVRDSDQICGGVWTQMFSLGRPDDPWRLGIPDIRMARNQFWPMHWHDCWIAVIVMDGQCLIGDWWMQPGDVLISPAKVEYGPVLNGPKGCQLLEIFARDIDAGGGYAPEFHDHPTLTELQNIKSGAAANFAPRPKISEVNAGNQTTPLKVVPGVLTGKLKGGQRWDLGDSGDPERGVMLDTLLPAGSAVPAHRHRDWRGVLVWNGSLRAGDEELTKDDLLVIEPGAEVPAFQAGPQGAHLMEFAKTAAGVATVIRSADRDNPAFKSGLAATADVEAE